MSVRRTVLLLSFVILAGLAAGSFFARTVLTRLLGPPAVEMREAYAESTGDAVFDHGAFDRLLAKHVDEDGLVAYDALAGQQGELDAYLDDLAAAPFDALGRDEKLALLINAYNAFTLRLVLDHGAATDLASIRDVPGPDRWAAERWMLSGRRLSLEAIEHEEIRARFREPRVHFALVCASRGCPPLRREAYTGAALEPQLADQTHRVLSNAPWVSLEDDRLTITPLFDWYRGDFEQVADSVLEFIARERPELQAYEGRLSWAPYDWALNRQP